MMALESAHHQLSHINHQWKRSYSAFHHNLQQLASMCKHVQAFIIGVAIGIYYITMVRHQSWLSNHHIVSPPFTIGHQWWTIMNHHPSSIAIITINSDIAGASRRRNPPRAPRRSRAAATQKRRPCPVHHPELRCVSGPPAEFAMGETSARKNDGFRWF